MPQICLVFYFCVSDTLPLYPGPDSAQTPYEPDRVIFRNFWSPPTNLYPYFLLPPSTHATAHASGTNRTQRTGTDTGTGTDFNHSSVEETLITSLQIPELVGPGESAFLLFISIPFFFLFLFFLFLLSS